LGYGDTNSRGTVSNEVGDYLPFIDLGSSTILKPIDISGGFYLSCALFNDQKSVKCWGTNTGGQVL